MAVMIVGLVLFLGMHSVRVVADDWRTAMIERVGLGAWKGVYSLVSIVGLAVAIWGFGLMRADPVFLWHPPAFLHHATALLMVPAFVFLVAAYVPRNHLRLRLGHPMLLAVKVWALAHLLVSGRLGEWIFFVAFLVWAVLAFKAARQRDRASPGPLQVPSAIATSMTVIGGLLAAILFAVYLHTWVVGVPAVAAR